MKFDSLNLPFSNHPINFHSQSINLKVLAYIIAFVYVRKLLK